MGPASNLPQTVYNNLIIMANYETYSEGMKIIERVDRLVCLMTEYDEQGVKGFHGLTFCGRARVVNVP